ncbi:unnamed protein product [Discula destructiva]
MRKLIKSSKLTRSKDTSSRPGTAESIASSRASEDLPRSPRQSLSSVSPATTNARNASLDSVMLPDLKMQQSPASERRPSASVANGMHTTPKRMASIRPVTSFDDGPIFSANTSFEASSRTNGRSDNSVLSSSPKSTASNASPAAGNHHPEQNGPDTIPAGRLRPKVSQQYLSRLNNGEYNGDYDGDSRTRSISPSTSPRPAKPEGSFQIPQRQSSAGGADTSASKMGAGQEGDGFDSSVGKAGLGKTGRVMNRLISENEALKRDLRIEKLNSEESRREAKLLEDKMERMIADYESRLLEANVTKTLLARKERQVESLHAAVDLEKKRTSDAQAKERTWREEMEKTQTDSTRKVEEATTHSALMEGRYNAISSHWKDQGDVVKRAMTKMGKEIAEMLEARKEDDEKITTLRDLCDQQDGNIKDLLKQKDILWKQFEDYKNQQEGMLKDIKANATEREAQQEEMLAEAKEVVDKLKWALNVKKEVPWAQ